MELSDGKDVSTLDVSEAPEDDHGLPEDHPDHPNPTKAATANCDRNRIAVKMKPLLSQELA